MEKRKIKVSGKIKFALMSLLLVVGVILNAVCAFYYTPITQYMSRFASSGNTNSRTDLSQEEAEKQGADITQKVEEEGIVLLKNDGTLPLESTKKINLFGFASYSPVYGGSGSGAVDETTNVSFKSGLENAGFSVNEDLWKFYEDSYTAREEQNIFSLSGNDHNIYEQPVSEYSDELMQSAKEYSDTAVVVFSRCGGEGGDLPTDMGEMVGGDAGKHYLELQQVELDLLHMVEDNFEKVIVVIDSSHVMELGVLEEEGIDAALIIGGPGSTGLNALGEILAGEVNPSGRLVDTYAYDLTSAPSYYSFGDFTYLNSTHEEKYNGIAFDVTNHFVDYVEGIYVGYRYYETRWIDNATGVCDEEAYRSNVQYPFGYGLSYTSFDQKITDFSADGDTVTVTVEVTNTGDVAGKDVVEVYYTPPYYEGGIEKAQVNLIGFDKTEILSPGESETVDISFQYDDMASYDYKDNRSYVLEHGDYEIKVMSNSHDVLDQRTVTVENDRIYNEEHDGARPSDLIVATNQFDEVSFWEEDNITWVSRADWENTLPKERVADRDASEQILDILKSEYKGTLIDPADDPEAEPITTGAKNGLTLADMTGLSYDDSQWDRLLDQLTIDDMKNLITRAGWGTPKIDSVGKPYCNEIDGPAGLSGIVDGTTSNQYTSEVVMAATWNTDLIYEMGTVFGEDCLAHGVSGIYGPAMNIHRSPFGGRCFEYYSEDGVLSGKMAAAEISGIMDQGIYVYAKHFAVNDQETNREGVCTWANEQSIREIYLKPFEIAVKEGHANGIMLSMNHVGTSWSGAHYGLVTTILRGEWGMDGVVITDGYAPSFQVCDAALRMNADIMVRAGGDLCLSNDDRSLTSNLTEVTTNSNYGLQCMREACHRELYIVANSAAMDAVTNVTPYWLAGLILVDVLIVGGWIFYIINIRKKKGLLKKETMIEG